MHGKKSSEIKFNPKNFRNLGEKQCFGSFHFQSTRICQDVLGHQYRQWSGFRKWNKCTFLWALYNLVLIKSPRKISDLMRLTFYQQYSFNKPTGIRPVVSPYRRRGGHIFVADTVGVGISVTVFCLRHILWTDQLADFNQICMDMTLGHEEQIRFWWPWSIFQGHCWT